MSNVRAALRATWLASVLVVGANAQAGQSERVELRDLTEWSGDVWRRLQALPVQPPVAKGHPVLVKKPKTGEPVISDVYVVARSCVDRATRVFLYEHFAESHLPLLASRFGTRYRTDHNGYVRVAMPEDGVVVAITDDRVGIRDAKEGRTLVAARERATIRAEVVDEDGRPLAHVPVQVSHVANGAQLVTACTDKVGRCVLRLPTGMIGAQLGLEARIVSPKRGMVLVPEGYFAKKPALLQVRVPRTGAVHVAIEDQLGALPKDSSQAVLAWGGDTASISFFGIPPSRWQDGRAIFAHVAPGLTVKATLKRGFHQGFEVRGEGPRQVDATSQLTMVVDEDTFVLRGRLTGAPEAVRAGAYNVRLVGEDEVLSEQCIVDADGRFLFAAVLAGVPEGESLHVEIFRSKEQFDAPGMVGLTKVAGDATGGIDVGDVKLQPERVIVRGRVMNGATPINAEVQAPLAKRPDGPIVHRLYSGLDGRFVVFEAGDAAGKLELTIRRGQPEKVHKVTATIGEAEQFFQIQAGLSVAFTVKQRCGLEQMVFEARPKAGGGRPVGGWATPDGFRFFGLDPGAYEVTVRLGGYELWRIDNLKVGDQPDDPRCQDVEWQRDLQVAELLITDAAGKPLDAGCHVATGDHKNSLALACDERGHLELPYAEGHQFFVRHRSYRAEIVRPAAKPQTIRMSRRAVLKLRLPEGIELPGSVVMHLSSELAQFGVEDQQYFWKPNQPNAVAVEARRRTVLRVRIYDLAGNHLVLHEQAIDLPESAEPLEVLVGIREEDAEYAQEIAAERAAERQGGGR